MVILLQVRLVIGGTGSRCHKMRNSTKYLMNGTRRDKSPLFMKTSVQSFKLSTFSNQPNQRMFLILNVVKNQYLSMCKWKDSSI